MSRADTKMTDSVDEAGTSELINSLLSADAFPHPVTDIQLLETHISWVVLTGDFAYKIKKPVKLEFLDFSTLAQRRHYCEVELELNRAWAPQVYLDVVPICGTAQRPAVDGDGDAIEYALRMRQFPQSDRLDNQLELGLISDADMRELAVTVATAHGRARVIDDVSAETAVRRVKAPMLDNFRAVRPFVPADTLRRIETWTVDEVSKLESVLRQRQAGGFVRECHGDLHLRNLVRLPTGIHAFDCVEFSLELRTLDVVSDIAFLVMDLAARNSQSLAYAFVNRYLERTGDYAGIAVLDLYVVYHSMIRAKVAAIRADERSDTDSRSADIEEILHYCAFACRWTERPRPTLIAMHGYSGSGKTWLSSELIGRLPAVRIRSDIERKRLHHLSETESSHSHVGGGIYTEAGRGQVYDRLMALAGYVLDAGYNVIVDASHLHAKDRESMRACAERYDAPLVWLTADAPESELLRRVRLRSSAGSAASEADESVLEHQLATADPLTSVERSRSVTVATDADPDIDRVIARIHSKSARTPEDPARNQSCAEK